jgi:putative oxidoreductase
MSIRTLNVLVKTTAESSTLAELAVTALRVFTGLALALAHGKLKLPPSADFIAGVGGMGFPVPTFFAWAAVLSEFLGGLLLAIGLLTRPAAVMIAITMGVAGFVTHARDPFRAKEMAFLYLAIAVFFAIRGAGRLSVDALISGGGSRGYGRGR